MNDDSARQPDTAASAIFGVPVLFLWGLGFALAGALGYTGALDSQGLLLCWGGLFAAALALARAGALSRPRLDWLAAVLLLELAWLVFVQWRSLLPGAGAYLSLSLALLPLGYLLVRAAGVFADVPDRLHGIVRGLAIPVFLLALLEFQLLRARAFSVFADANLLAAFANAVLFPALADWVLASASGGQRAVALPRAATLLAVVTLAVTTSLGGFLCFCAALLLFVTFARTRTIWRPVAVMLGAGLAASLVVYSLQDSRPSPLSRMAQELARPADASRNQGVGERLAMVRSSLAIYADHAWYGTGPGTFKILYPRYRSPDDRSTAGNMVHNDYVQLLQEGGPPLLAVLLAAAVSLLLSLRRLFGDSSEAVSLADRDRRIQRLGVAAALLALFIHAAVNFIFYAAPIALLAGVYLAMLSDERSGRALALDRVLRPHLAWFLYGIAALALTVTLGFRTVFTTLLAQECRLHVCDRLGRDNGFMTKFANVMIATQPSWFYSRLYLARLHADAARAGGSADDRLRLAQRAAAEFGSVVADYPALYDPLRQLGDLLSDFPAAAGALPATVPHDREALYRLTLQRNPLDFQAAASAAQLMVQRGAPAEAFRTTLDTVRFWDTALVTNADRVRLLNVALPLALQLGECRQAWEMSMTLRSIEAENTLASRVLDAFPQPDSIHNGVGCGLSAEPGGRD